jgi:hypothetical protein
MLIGQFAAHSPGNDDDLLLVDSTPVECAPCLERGDQWELLLTERELVDNAVEEMLRSSTLGKRLLRTAVNIPSLRLRSSRGSIPHGTPTSASGGCPTSTSGARGSPRFSHRPAESKVAEAGQLAEALADA